MRAAVLFPRVGAIGTRGVAPGCACHVVCLLDRGGCTVGGVAGEGARRESLKPRSVGNEKRWGGAGAVA